MTLSNAERQARWRAKRDAEIERLRKAASPARAAKAAAAPSDDGQELIEARREVERLRKRLDEWLQFDAVYDVWLHEADKIVKSRKGVMTRAQWTHLVRCLHEDHRGKVTDEDFNRACRMVIRLKLALLSEREEPTRPPKKPQLNWDDMMRRRTAKMGKRKVAKH